MNEFIEKLIGRLEEEATSYKNDSDKEYRQGAYEEAKEDMISSVCLRRAIQIVNQLAEEYNNGWIPCLERTPLVTGYYLVTIKGFNRAMYAWWISTEEKWQYLNSQKEITEVIAWQPLPAPYQPKGE